MSLKAIPTQKKEVGSPLYVSGQPPLCKWAAPSMQVGSPLYVSGQPPLCKWAAPFVQVQPIILIAMCIGRSIVYRALTVKETNSHVDHKQKVTQIHTKWDQLIMYNTLILFTVCIHSRRHFIWRG